MQWLAHESLDNLIEMSFLGWGIDTTETCKIVLYYLKIDLNSRTENLKLHITIKPMGIYAHCAPSYSPIFFSMDKWDLQSSSPTILILL